VLGGEMTHLNRKDSRYVITAAATIFTLAIMTASIMATAPAIATTTLMHSYYDIANNNV